MESLFRDRAKLYSFLARIYRAEPDQKFLNEIKALDLSGVEDEAPEREGYQLIYDYAKNAYRGLLELARDYARCFIGAGMPRHEVAFPYESVFTSEKGLMQQEAYDEVMIIYAGESLVKDGKLSEPDDHISFEFEFMAFLSERTADNFIEENNGEALRYCGKQLDFLNIHLLKWIPMFCKKLSGVANTDFYKGAAKLTEAFLTNDKKILLEVLEELKASKG
ncbi:MAG: molecular chaperone TorD family protein [Deferribacteraceae bacterium]|jgi:TorA maturation chaperone TorD|nr:molecular chaperone TorD family protein [Deferribacteraceae bacterium]